jgi:hypothetical protein
MAAHLTLLENKNTQLMAELCKKNSILSIMCRLKMRARDEKKNVFLWDFKKSRLFIACSLPMQTHAHCYYVSMHRNRQLCKSQTI